MNPDPAFRPLYRLERDQRHRPSKEPNPKAQEKNYMQSKAIQRQRIKKKKKAATSAYHQSHPRSNLLLLSFFKNVKRNGSSKKEKSESYKP
jgi:hypothetical protein